MSLSIAPLPTQGKGYTSVSTGAPLVPLVYAKMLCYVSRPSRDTFHVPAPKAVESKRDVS